MLGEKLKKWIEGLSEKDRELLVVYKKVANATDETINIGTFYLFKRLTINGLTDNKLAYSVADEIIANRIAIYSLDSHVTRLMTDINNLKNPK